MNQMGLWMIGCLLLVSTSASATIVRFVEVDPGRVYRGSQPNEEQDYQILKSMGIRTIVNLMHSNEKHYVDYDREMAAKYGIRFVSTPLPSTWMGKPPYINSLFSKPTDKQIIRALKAIVNPELQPVFVHCRFGKDRTGVMAGIYRVLQQGWSKSDAYEEAREMGFTPFEAGLYKYWRKTSLDRCSLLWRAIYGDQGC